MHRIAHRIARRADAPITTTTATTTTTTAASIGAIIATQQRVVPHRDAPPRQHAHVPFVDDLPVRRLHAHVRRVARERRQGMMQQPGRVGEVGRSISCGDGGGG